MDQNLWEWTIDSLFSYTYLDIAIYHNIQWGLCKSKKTAGRKSQWNYASVIDKENRNAEIKFGFQFSYIHAFPETTLNNIGDLTYLPFTYKLIFRN